MCHINFPHDLTGGSSTGFGTTGTFYIKSNDQKKKDLITRLIKDDLITLDEALLLLDKSPESPLTFGTTTTYGSPNMTFTNTGGHDKDLIN